MRIVFMGTPEYAVQSLKALVENGYDVAGVFTQPDKPRGRGGKVQMPEAKVYANSRGIPVFQPRKIRADGVDALKALAPDLCVTAAFGQILSQEILDIPKFGTINVHASLLPKYRGSSPINWCLINGETVTGVTTMLTAAGIDTGDILLQRETGISPLETAGELTGRLGAMGAELLIDTIRALEAGRLSPIRQDESVMSYYPMLHKEMGEIVWTQSARSISNLVRGLNPWPGAYTDSARLGRLKLLLASAEAGESAAPGTVLEADRKNGLLIQAGEGAVRVLTLQAQGGKPMKASDYLLGHPITTGEGL